jgi:hypothetical protein
MGRFPELLLGFLFGFASLLIILVVSSDATLHETVAAIDGHNGVITALATIAIAWFTLSLKQATDRLWDAGERQLKLAREALVADQRAWLIVTGFEIESVKIGKIVDGAAGATVEGILKISNVGRTPAVKSDVEVALIGNYGTDFAAVQDFALKNERNSLIGGRLISAGEAIELEVWAYAPGEELYQYGMKGKISPLIVGCINYQILQDSQVRQTAFVYRPVRADNGMIFIQDGDLTVNDVTAVTGSGGFAN